MTDDRLAYIRAPVLRAWDDAVSTRSPPEPMIPLAVRAVMRGLFERKADCDESLWVGVARPHQPASGAPPTPLEAPEAIPHSLKTPQGRPEPSVARQEAAPLQRTTPLSDKLRPGS